MLSQAVSGHTLSFWLGTVWTAYVLCLSLWIVWQRRSPVSTLAWVMLLSLMPIIGFGVYAWFGPQRVKRQRLRRWRHRAASLSRHDMQQLTHDLPDVPAWAARHARLIETSCGLPLASALRADILPSGGATYDALLAAIASARQHVHLEYYIFEPDRTGQQICHALAERARAGVRVRLLVDAVGSARLLSRRHRPLVQSLRAAWVELAVFHPARLDRLRPLANLRTHRKIVVIDGSTGFVGGINISDAENEHLHPAAAWRDTHLLLQGGVVRWLQYLFLQDWGYAGGRVPARDDSLLPEQPAGAVPAQVVASGPDTDDEAIHRAVIDALNMARQRIWLATPYFVPTEAALMALTNAARRGVQVKLMMPARSDSRIVSAAARSYYRELQDSGVLIFEYQPRMLHAKTLLVDELYGMVGSANFDNRSFRLNFEVAAVVTQRSFNEQLARQFDADLSHCRRVPRRRPLSWRRQMFEALARLASPLL